MADLAIMGYNHIHNDMFTSLSKRWHEETVNFYLPVRKMTKTFNDISYLLIMLIECRLMNHTIFNKFEVVELMVNLIGFDPEEAEYKVEKTDGVIHNLIF